MVYPGKVLIFGIFFVIVCLLENCKNEAVYFCSHRLAVRTQPFQGWYRGSIPRGSNEQGREAPSLFHGESKGSVGRFPGILRGAKSIPRGSIKKRIEWWGARVVERDGLENRYTCKGIVSSNLTPTDIKILQPLVSWKILILYGGGSKGSPWDSPVILRGAKSNLTLAKNLKAVSIRLYFL